MKKRGRILREASNGPGLITCEGQQLEFQLEGLWTADTAPVIDTVVDIEVDENNKISALSPVSEGQLAKEQADKALQMAKDKGGVVLNEAIRRVGKPVLISSAVLMISWFFLSAITVQASQFFTAKFTFWELLSLVNGGSGGIMQALQSGGGNGSGIYGFLAFISLLGPFAFQFWKDPKAHLGNCLPLLVMLVVGVSIYMGIQDGMKASQQVSAAYGGADGAKIINGMMNEMMKAAMEAIHIGAGLYLSMLASLYLAFIGVTRFLAAKA